MGSLLLEISATWAGVYIGMVSILIRDCEEWGNLILGSARTRIMVNSEGIL